MDISVVIPTAESDKERVNWTVASFLDNAVGEVECVVVLNGFNMAVDPRAKTIRFDKNLGERVAMNAGAEMGVGKLMCRIDAHCTVPPGWDRMLMEVFDQYPNALVVPTIGALESETDRTLKEHHRYKFCKLLPTMEEKWWDKKTWQVIEPNMACTGCGMTMNRQWFVDHGGVDEKLPPMGAIGPECSMMAHIYGDGVWTRTDLVMGHLWNVGGYDTSGVARARQMLVMKYGKYYPEVCRKLGLDMEETKASRTGTTDKNHRVITVRREDRHTTRDDEGKIVKEVVEHFVYVYEDDGTGPSEDEIRAEYGPKGHKVGEDVYLPDQDGQLVKIGSESAVMAC